MQFLTLCLHGKLDQLLKDDGSSYGVELHSDVVFPVGIQWTRRASEDKTSLINHFGSVPHGFLRVHFLPAVQPPRYGMGQISNDLLTSPTGGATIVQGMAFLEEHCKDRSGADGWYQTPYAVLITHASMQVIGGSKKKVEYRLVPEIPGPKHAVFINVITDEQLWSSGGGEDEASTYSRTDDPQVLCVGDDCTVLRPGQSFDWVMWIPPARRVAQEKVIVTVHFDGQRVGWSIDERDYEYPPESKDVIS